MHFYEDIYNKQCQEHGGRLLYMGMETADCDFPNSKFYYCPVCRKAFIIVQGEIAGNVPLDIRMNQSGSRFFYYSNSCDIKIKKSKTEKILRILAELKILTNYFFNELVEERFTNWHYCYDETPTEIIHEIEFSENVTIYLVWCKWCKEIKACAYDSIYGADILAFTGFDPESPELDFQFIEPNFDIDISAVQKILKDIYPMEMKRLVIAAGTVDV